MKIGFLFPGQGSQSVGMGKDIYDKYEMVKSIYHKVKEITGIDIAEVSFDGPEEKLNETKYTQLAILTMSLAILEVLKKEGIQADISAGLSLGEYSALIYSGAISFEDGVKIVKQRGQYMQELAPKGDWQMAAVLGMSDEDVEKICKRVTTGFVVPANYNCNGQVVISGEKQGVESAEILAKEAGAKRVVPLKTAGPFHTSKLIDASNALREELENIDIQDFKTKVVKNIDGTIYTSKDNVKDILAKHIISPVKFSKTLETMVQEGIDTFIEIGPGKSLSGFAKKIDTDKQINIFNINNVQTLNDTINFIKKEGIINE